jgi:hypothetical protein
MPAVRGHLGTREQSGAGPMKSTIFLSYPSSLEEMAARIELSLEGEGYAVFRDRSALPPGESFDARIRAAVEESDLFVFLITPESVSPGRYTLTELKLVEQRWGHPAGRVLPVLAEATPMEAIPAFLRAVTILKPHGNLVAEVAAEVARLSAPWWRRMLEPRRLVPAVIVALLLAGSAWLGLPSYLERRQQNAEAAALVDRSRPQVEAGNYANAWELLEQANAVAPASREVFEVQEQLAMKLLRGAGLNYPNGDRDSDKALANWARPVLARGSSGASGGRLANLLAHMGWADYLRGGFAGSGGFIGKEMRPKGWGPGSFKNKVWSIYYFGFVDEDKRAPLLAALPPADHLATFHWLFPADDPESDGGEYWYFNYVFVLAQLREYGGDRAGALVSYSRLLGSARSQKYNSSRAIEMVEQANVAIRRLGG